MEYRASTFYLLGSEQAPPQVQASEGAAFLYVMDVPDYPVNDAWVMRLLTDGTVESNSPIQRSMARGILGKWNYVPEKDVFLNLADGSTGDMWADKPDNWLGGGFASLAPSAVPVPQTLGLLGFGLLWLVGVGRVSHRVARG